MKYLILIFFVILSNCAVLAEEFTYTHAKFGQSYASLVDFHFHAMMMDSGFSYGKKLYQFKSRPDSAPCYNTTSSLGCALEKESSPLKFKLHDWYSAWLYGGGEFNIIYDVVAANMWKYAFVREAEVLATAFPKANRLEVRIEKQESKYVAEVYGYISTCYLKNESMSGFRFTVGQPVCYPHKLLTGAFAWDSVTEILTGYIKDETTGSWQKDPTLIYFGKFKKDNSAEAKGLADRINQILDDTADIRHIAQLTVQGRDTCLEAKQGIGNLYCGVDSRERILLKDSIVGDSMKAGGDLLALAVKAKNSMESAQRQREAAQRALVLARQQIDAEKTSKFLAAEKAAALKKQQEKEKRIQEFCQLTKCDKPMLAFMEKQNTKPTAWYRENRVALGVKTFSSVWGKFSLQGDDLFVESSPLSAHVSRNMSGSKAAANLAIVGDSYALKCFTEKRKLFGFKFRDSEERYMDTFEWIGEAIRSGRAIPVLNLLDVCVKELNSDDGRKYE